MMGKSKSIYYILMILIINIPSKPIVASDQSSELVIEVFSSSVIFPSPVNFKPESDDYSYYYRIDGLIKNWKKINTPYLHLEDLSPGKYKIQFKVENSTKKETYYPNSLNIIINRNLWESLAFKLVVTLVIFLLLTLWYLYTNKKNNEVSKNLDEMTKALISKAKRLEKINDFVSQLNKKSKFDDMLKLLLRKSFVIEDVDVASIIEIDKTSKNFSLICSVGLEKLETDNIFFTSDEIYSRYLLNAERIVDNIYINNKVDPLRFLNRKINFPKSMIVFELKTLNNLNGYLVLENISSSGSFDKYDEATLVKLYNLLLDVYENIKVENVKEYKNKNKDYFLGFAAHDLRNPLSSIVMQTSLVKEYLSDEKFDISKVNKLLDSTIIMTTKMKQILSELLDITAIETGNINMNFEPIHPYDVILNNLEFYINQASKKEITICLSRKLRFLKPIYADKNKFIEVVDNLLSNAIKYTERGGYINIDGFAKSSKTVISIVDNGQGMTANDLEKIFDGFTKLSSKPTGGETSTGLGMMIVKKLMQLQKGDISVESELGKGTKMKLEFKTV